MLHGKRRHSIKTYATPEDLATDIKRVSWVLCAGFRWKDIVLLNDSTSEDGMFECAVAMLGPGVFVDSWTIEWMSVESIVAKLRELDAIDEAKDASRIRDFGTYNETTHKTECPLCA